MKELLEVFLCSGCTLIKKANKAQETKVEDQEEAQVLSFAPEATWVGKQEHALETCDNASRF